MRDRLKEIKRIVEQRVGFKIDGVDRRRDMTYARAVYARIARDIQLDNRATYSYEDIGKPINKNYATVLHYLKNTFHYAMSDIKFKQLYDDLYKAFVLNDPFEGISELDTISEMARDINIINDKFNELKSKYIDSIMIEDKFANMVKDLSEEELEEVYEVVELRIKAIKSRVYA